jgi:Inositol monophosphatase family
MQRSRVEMGPVAFTCAYPSVVGNTKRRSGYVRVPLSVVVVVVSHNTNLHVVQDHAPGSLLVEEAGGVISDLRGRPLDFGRGRTLGENFGVVAARKEIHAQVIEAIQAALAGEEGGREESVVCIQPSSSSTGWAALLFVWFLTSFNR